MPEMVFNDSFKHEMIEKYFDTVYRLALNQMKDKSLAEDVCQDVFLKFIRHNKTYESEEHVKAWLIRVTINCSKNVFASSFYKKSAPLIEDIPYEEDLDTKSDVLEAVSLLPKKYRAVIHLYYYEDMKIEEISQVLDIKESTVKSQLKRGRELLKKTLKGGEYYEF